MTQTNKEIEELKSRMKYDTTLPGSGWHDIILNLDKKLKMLDPEYEILQIKEKFGSLRYYYESNVKITAVKEAMDRYVRNAELQSARTCERCGLDADIKKIKYTYKAICKKCLITQTLEAISL